MREDAYGGIRMRDRCCCRVGYPEIEERLTGLESAHWERHLNTESDADAKSTERTRTREVAPIE